MKYSKPKCRSDITETWYDQSSCQIHADYKGTENWFCLKKTRSKSTSQTMKVCSKWVCLEASWVDSQRFMHFYEGLDGVCVCFPRHYRHFWPFWGHFSPVLGHIRAILGPRRDILEPKGHLGDFGPFLGDFGGHFVMILTSFWGCFDIVLASFWADFGMFLTDFGMFLAFYRKAKNGSFWEVLGI